MKRTYLSLGLQVARYHRQPVVGETHVPRFRAHYYGGQLGLCRRAAAAGGDFRHLHIRVQSLLLRLLLLGVKGKGWWRHKWLLMHKFLNSNGSLKTYFLDSCGGGCLNTAKDKELLGIHGVRLGGNCGVYVDAQELQGFIAEICGKIMK